jgi:type I restriction enzyme, S subunit
MTDRYKAYSEYKESGVGWLEKVPPHWDITKTAWHFVAEKGKNGQVLTNEYIGQNNGDYPVYSGQTGNNGVMGCIDTYEFDTGKEGVLFSTTVGAKAMTLNHLKGKFSLSQNCLIIQKTSPIFNTRFCFYHFQPLFSFERGLIPEHMQASFRMEDLYQYKIALPSFEEQQKIANFLDHETAKIDTLITKQEKLIELLKEKRQAVISHAVTKGLNPDAPMKDSGVEWLGEVPEHWTISPSKRLFPESKNRAPTSDMQLSATQDYGVISQKKFMQLAGRKVVQLNSNQELRKKVHVGDFVISMRSFQGGLERAWDEGGIRSSYVVLKPSETVNKDYFQYLFKSVRYIQAIQSTANFIRDGQDMNYQNFVSIDLPLPSLEEQEYIALHLREHINKIDSLVERAQKAISLMQERKTALISAAVTGKIDVRHFVAEQG